MLRRTLLAAPLAAVALAACNTSSPTSQPVGVQTSSIPLLIAPVGASLAPDSSSETGGCLPDTSRSSTRPPAASSGPFFRDDFNGDVLDGSRWVTLDNDGVVLVQNGRLLMVGTGSRNFPRLISRVEVFPSSGPRFLELRYELLTDGWVPGFNLDYLPAMRPGERALERPFASSRPFYSGLMISISPFDQASNTPGPDNTCVPGKPHTFRIEVDAEENHRFIIDDREVTKHPGPGRPVRNFWIGNELFPTGEPLVWSKLAIDYFETGKLTKPADARPLNEPIPVAPAPVAPEPVGPPSPVPAPGEASGAPSPAAPATAPAPSPTAKPAADDPASPTVS
ncbi:MAG: hypothetical protein VKS61_06325 [Candidatus Sericytochromatia bacterium]|nr:hypothetical protein [Candidatus Sericytochromatia bacterium]